jgi:hypothetical protein
MLCRKRNVVQQKAKSCFEYGEVLHIIYADNHRVYFGYMHSSNNTVELYKVVMGLKPQLIFETLMCDEDRQFGDCSIDCFAYNFKLNKFVFWYVVNKNNENKLCVDFCDEKNIGVKNTHDFEYNILEGAISLVKISLDGNCIVFPNREKYFECWLINNKGFNRRFVSKLSVVHFSNYIGVNRELEMSQNGEYVAFISFDTHSNKRIARIYDQNGNEKKHNMQDDKLHRADISNDGKLMYTYRYSNVINYFDYKTGVLSKIIVKNAVQYTFVNVLCFCAGNCFVVYSEHLPSIRKLQKCEIIKSVDNNPQVFKVRMVGYPNGSVEGCYVNSKSSSLFTLEYKKGQDHKYEINHYQFFSNRDESINKIVQKIKQGDKTDYCDIKIMTNGL